MKKTYTLNEIIDILLKEYSAHGQDRPLEYTYGYFDVVGILRELDEKS